MYMVWCSVYSWNGVSFYILIFCGFILVFKNNSVI